MITDRMINTFVGIATLALALSIALPSAADSNIYIEYSGGASFVADQSLSGADASGALLMGRASSNIGFNFGGAVGTRFLKYFRSEIQVSYRQNEVENLSLQGESNNASGHISLLAVMVNGYFDYDLGIGFVPYIGVGVGWGSVEIDAKSDAGAFTSQVEGEDSVFTYSVMAGASYPINEILDLSLGYRYIATTDPTINSSISAVGARRLDAEFDSHEIVFGLRFNF